MRKLKDSGFETCLTFCSVYQNLQMSAGKIAMPSNVIIRKRIVMIGFQGEGCKDIMRLLF